MIKLLKKLNEPFPESPSYKGHLKTLTGISIFITLFLYLFRPFELHRFPTDPFWLCASFGLITFLTSVTFDFITIKIINLQRDVPSWTLWKWIIDKLVLVLFIAIGNYFFMVYCGWQSFRWLHFSAMLVSTFSLGIFPIIFSGMMIQIREQEKNSVQAAFLQSNLATALPTATNESRATVTLSSQKNTQTLTLPIADLLYLEAMQNYVSASYLKDGKVERALFRNTIKNMENQLENTALIRCHRSFMVNTDLIENVAGNAQGLRLSLPHLPDFEVPVSRKYIPTLKKIKTPES
ncbi:MAG: LytTR family DNA-binding domain-containing protein [Bacteroidota bacterium]